MTDHVLSGLIRKRAELAGMIEATQDALRQHIIDLDNLDATIRLFAPDIDLAEIRPKPLPPRHAAFKGEVSRVVLEALRHSDRPLTAQELAQRYMAHRGMNTSDKRMVRLIGKRVGACLRHWRARGVVKCERGSGQMLGWRLTKNDSFQ
ncbi:MAG: hypothetical protein KIT81_16115 [Alphaproteobacteria bacterium]|nr:hypothetical protein [Alphaproteobacteria bacterium]